MPNVYKFIFLQIHHFYFKVSTAKVFNKDNIKGSCPKIPQQNNFTDCGLYLLQYVEHFFKVSINL